MKLDQFITEMKTTKEIVRYYIDEQLITLKKIQGRYIFTEVEINDLQNISELIEMRLPIRSIKKLKKVKNIIVLKSNGNLIIILVILNY